MSLFQQCLCMFPRFVMFVKHETSTWQKCSIEASKSIDCIEYIGLIAGQFSHSSFHGIAMEFNLLLWNPCARKLQILPGKCRKIFHQDFNCGFKICELRRPSILVTGNINSWTQLFSTQGGGEEGASGMKHYTGNSCHNNGKRRTQWRKTNES